MSFCIPARYVIRTGTLWAVLLSCLSVAPASASGEAVTALTDEVSDRIITLLYVGGKDNDAARGVRQGVSEGQLQGRFLNFSVRLIERADASSASAVTAADVIIADLPAADLSRLAQSAASNVPVINISAYDEKLRTGCHAHLLHTIATDAMLTAATRAWRAKKKSDTGDAVVWHPDFKKFAARDLNKRYKKAHGLAMNSIAWAGWAASRSVVDAYAQGGLTAVQSLARPDRGGFIFDGQKGSKMSFLPNGQMQQLLLIQSDDRLLGEAPGLYPAKDIASADCR